MASINNNVVNKQITSPWRRPWDVTKFNDLYNRDERYFSILIKGFLGWMNRNIVLYGKYINHFIFNTGSSVLYMENNGYDFSWNETTGNDEMYMHLPRCVVTLGNISIPTEEMTQPYSRGYYERLTIEENKSDVSCQPWDRKISYIETIRGYNAEIQRLPIELSVTLNYALSNMNEVLILTQELIDKLMFQRYFNINYLGQIIQCSIEFPSDIAAQLNKIDMTSTEPNIRTIELGLKICSNYPIINTRTEIPADKVIERFNEGYKKEKYSLVSQRMPNVDDWKKVNYNFITNTYTFYSTSYNIYSYYSGDNDDSWFWSYISGATDWTIVRYIKEMMTYILYSRSLQQYSYYCKTTQSGLTPDNREYVDKIDYKKFTYFDTNDNKYTDIEYEYNTYNGGVTSYTCTPYSRVLSSGISLYRGDPNKSSAILTDHEDWRIMNFEVSYKIN